jgi:hypothetical protein
LQRHFRKRGNGKTTLRHHFPTWGNGKTGVGDDCPIRN